MIEDVLTPLVRELGLGILVGATVIMAAATAVTSKLERSSAAVRNTIWSAAFSILVVLPIVSLTVPAWFIVEIDGPAATVPVRPDGRIVGESSAKAQLGDYGKIGSGDSGEPGIPVSGHAGDIGPEGAGSARRSESRDEKAASGRVIVVVLFSIWLLGAAVLLSRFVVQILAVGRITRRAIRVEGTGLGCHVRNLVASLDIRQRVSVMLSEEACMPFAWGVVNPVVILPIDAGEWPQDRIRSVVTHELAHIARWDYPIHLVIELVRALYWPNPIVWFAARKSVMERERACDDFALRLGTPSADYAEHLLQMARMQLEGSTPIAAVTMAGEPGLLERIDHVMNGKLDRSPLPKGMLVMTAALVALLVLTVDSTAFRTISWKIPGTRGLIAQLSGDGNEAARSMAAWWLGEHETARGVDALLEAMRDDSRIVRLTSGWALGEIKDRDSIDGLIETLETDKDLLVREMAALALGEIEDPSAVGELEEACESDKRLARAVIWALGEIAGRGGQRADNLREEIIDQLGERPWRNEQVWTGTLGEKPARSRDVASLIEDLANDGERQRRDAAFNLGLLGIEQGFETVADVETAVHALIATLEDPVAEVRAMAVWALDEINPSRKKVSLGFFRKRRD